MLPKGAFPAWTGRSGTAFLAAFLLLFLSGPDLARAQQEPREAPAEAPPPARPAPALPPTTIRSTPEAIFAAPVGPGLRPAATLELHGSLGLSEEYTDNFNLTAREGQSNFRTALSPGAVLLIKGAATTGQIGYTLSAAHDSTSEEVSLFHALLGQVAWQATPLLTLTASDALTRSDEPSRADQLSLRRERRTFLSNTFALGANYLIANIGTQGRYRISTFFDEDGTDTVAQSFGVGASTGLYATNTLSVGYDYLTSETSRGGTAGDSETRSHQFTASFIRQLSSLLQAGVTGSLALYTQTQGRPARDSDFRIWNGSFVSTYTLPERFTWSSSLGLGWLESDTGVDRLIFSTVTSLTYTFARATAALSVDQGLSPTFAEGENFGVVETRGIRASLSYPFTPSISGTASAYYRQNEFTGLGGGGQANRQEDTYGGSLAFSVQLLRWLTLDLEYAYTRATSDDSRGGYTQNRARATLNAAF